MYRIKNYNQYSLLIIALVFASVIINLFIKNDMDFSYLVLDMEDVSYIINQNHTWSAMYVVIKRLKHFTILFLLIKAIKLEYVYNGIIILAGAIIGMLLSIQTFYLGISGVMIFLLYILPHYIFYFMAISYAYKIKITTGYGEEKLRKILIIIFLFALGVFCECFFSRFFLIKFYQYMVI